jgi:glutamine phosphoribosylpyrophosphate amidotransferase
MVRAAGATEIHMRISRTISPCFYGIDTPNRRTHRLEPDQEIGKYIEAD